jgi:FKBP-type peptidyl-prolyl cis-trans isomerase
MKSNHLGAAAAALILVTLAAPSMAADGATGKMIELLDGLKYTDTTLGTGVEATRAHKVTVQYTGWLSNNGEKGRKFDSSVGGTPLAFTLGAKQVVPGFDEGVSGMKVGGKRTVIIPPELGYGAKGAGGVIPPNATLIFDLELLKVE